MLTLKKWFLQQLLMFSLALVSVTGSAAGLAQSDCAGLWRGDTLLATMEAHVEQDGERISGVVYVSSLWETNPYHFKGVVKDGVIEASHHSGHSFKGRIVEDGKVEGTVTTAKKKHKIELVAERVKAETP